MSPSGGTPGLIKGPVTPLPAFRSLTIELTERCNLNCVHCYINRPDEDRRSRALELSTADWKRIIAQAVDSGTLTVRFTGGEPLLRPDFGEIYRFTRKLGMRVKLFTNATLFTPAVAEMLGEIPPLDTMEITVFGMQPTSYEAVTRRRGSFKAFRRGIDLLVRHRVPFAVKGVWLPQNREEVEAFESWATTLPGINEPPAYSFFFDLRTRRDSKAKNLVISGLRPGAESMVKFMSRRRKTYEKETKQFLERFPLRPMGDVLLDCGAGHTSTIDAYGLLQPCMLIRHSSLVVDLKRLNLREALHTNLDRIEKVRAHDPRYLQRCARCFIRNLCQQCPGKSWSEHGTLDTPVEYLCQVAHAQARGLGLLEAGEKAWEIEEWPERVDRAWIGRT